MASLNDSVNRGNVSDRMQAPRGGGAIRIGMGIGAFQQIKYIKETDYSSRE